MADSSASSAGQARARRQRSAISSVGSGNGPAYVRTLGWLVGEYGQVREYHAQALAGRRENSGRALG